MTKTVIVPLANNRTAELTRGEWNQEAVNAFQEGQCLAFAVALAEHFDGDVRVYWGEDDRLIHAVALMGSLERDSEVPEGGSFGIHYPNCETEDYTPNAARQLEFVAPELPAQNYEVAEDFLKCLLDKLAETDRL